MSLGPINLGPTSVETARKYPALGFDPAPGATERIWSLAADLRSVAAELEAAHQTLISVGRGGGVWQGEAAGAFHNRLGELPDYLKQGQSIAR
jgi:PPE-repeat protein